MDREAWWATVHGAAKSWTQLGDQHPPNTHSIFIYHLLLWSLTIALGVREGRER